MPNPTLVLHTYILAKNTVAGHGRISGQHFSTLQNSYFTITQCQKNPADCVMVKLEFCNVEKVIFAVLYLQPLGHPYSVVINWTVFNINTTLLNRVAYHFLDVGLCTVIDHSASREIPEVADVNCIVAPSNHCNISPCSRFQHSTVCPPWQAPINRFHRYRLSTVTLSLPISIKHRDMKHG